ncbi:MAG: hypothetical protein WDW38_002376 [Sanguina aurantia]
MLSQPQQAPAGRAAPLSQRAAEIRLTHLLVTCPSQLELQRLLSRPPSPLNSLHVAAGLHRLCKLASLEATVIAATDSLDTDDVEQGGGGGSSRADESSPAGAEPLRHRQQQQQQQRPFLIDGGAQGFPWWLSEPREPKQAQSVGGGFRNSQRRSSISNMQAASGTADAWWEEALLPSSSNGFRSGSAWDPTRGRAVANHDVDGAMWEDGDEGAGSEDGEQSWQGSSPNLTTPTPADPSSSSSPASSQPAPSPTATPSRNSPHPSPPPSPQSHLFPPQRQARILSPYQASLALSKQLADSLVDKLWGAVGGLDGRGVASVVASLARLNFADPELLDLLVGASTPLLASCSCQNLATLVWGLDTLKHTPSPEWCAAFLAASQPLLATAHPASLATICYRFGGFRHRPSDAWLAAACDASLAMRRGPVPTGPEVDGTQADSSGAPTRGGAATPESAGSSSSSSSSGGSPSSSRSSSSSSGVSDADAGLTSFTGEQLSDFLSGLSLMRHLPEDAWMRAYFATTAPLLPRYSARYLGRSLSALASLGCRPDDAWMQAFYAAWRPALSSLTGARLSSLMASLAKLNCRPQGEWMNEVLKRSRKAVAGASLLQLTQLLTGLAGLRFKASEAWMAQLYGALFQKLPFFQPADYITVVAALARLRHRPPIPWLTQLTAHLLPILPMFDGEQLSQLVSGLASTKAKPSAAWLLAFELHSNAKLSVVTPSGLSALASALAALKYQPSISWLYAFVLSSYAQLDTFDAAQLAAVFGSLPSISPYPSWVDELIQVCASERYTRPQTKQRRRSSASRESTGNGSSSGGNSTPSSSQGGDNDYDSSSSSSSSSSGDDDAESQTGGEPQDWTRGSDGRYVQPGPGFSGHGSGHLEFRDADGGGASSGAGLFSSSMVGGGCISRDSMDFGDRDAGPSSAALLTVSANSAALRADMSDGVVEDGMSDFWTRSAPVGNGDGDAPAVNGSAPAGNVYSTSMSGMQGRGVESKTQGT